MHGGPLRSLRYLGLGGDHALVGPDQTRVSLLIAVGGFLAKPDVLSGAESGLSIYDTVRKMSASPPARLANMADRLVSDAQVTFARIPDLPEDAEVLFVQMVERSLPDARAIVAANMQADALCDAMLGRLSDREHRAPPVPALFRDLVQPVLRAMLAETTVAADLMPAWMAGVSGDLGELKSGQAEQTAMLRQLPALLEMRQAERANLQSELTRTQSELGTTTTLLQSFLKKVVGRHVPPSEFAETLFQMAADWNSAGERLSALDASHNMSPRLAGLQAEAMAAYNAEDVDRAWILLTEIEQEEEAAFARIAEEIGALETARAARRLSVLATKETKIAIARSQLDVAATARLELEKLALDGGGFDALLSAQNAWYERGRDKGLRFDLEVSVALAEAARDRASAPDEVGTALNDLGNALWTLGERETGTDRLEDAVAAFREALKKRTRNRVPLNWAMTQNDLGNALCTLGERETGTDRLEDAVTAYREALKERTRERVPLDWAMTQSNLGTALRTFGLRRNSPDQIEKAVVAYRSSLKEWSREQVTLEWAATKHNLGIALWTLGGFYPGIERMVEAVAAHEEALTEFTRDRVPLDWATTQNSLGLALGSLAVRETGTNSLEKAVDAFNSALLERTHERAPMHWAMTQENLAIAFEAWAEKTDGSERAAHLDRAVLHLDKALEVFDPVKTPYNHDKAVNLRARLVDKKTR